MNQTEPQLNVNVLDVDSSITNYGRHNRCIIMRDVADPSELLVREDLRGLPLTTDADRRRVANGWQRLHPRGSRLVYESSTRYTTSNFGESIEHIYRVVA